MTNYLIWFFSYLIQIKLSQSLWHSRGHCVARHTFPTAPALTENKTNTTFPLREKNITVKNCMTLLLHSFKKLYNPEENIYVRVLLCEGEFGKKYFLISLYFWRKIGSIWMWFFQTIFVLFFINKFSLFHHHHSDKKDTHTTHSRSAGRRRKPGTKI